MSPSAPRAEAALSPHGRLQALLADVASSDGALGAAVATRDGLVAAHALPPAAHPDTLCAMAAAALAAAETAWMQAGLGEVVHLGLHGSTPGGLYTLDDRFFLVLVGGDMQTGAAAAERVRKALASTEG